MVGTIRKERRSFTCVSAMFHRHGFLKFRHTMNVTSRVFIALFLVSKINAYPTRQFRQAALLNSSMLCKIYRVCENRIVAFVPK